MASYVRKVKTSSGATAVQIVVKRGGVRQIVEHLGSAHDDVELAVLLQDARERLAGGQDELDLGLRAPADPPSARVLSSSCRLAWQVLTDDELMAKTLATATVDRLLHHAHICQTSGESVRQAQALAGQGVSPLS